jgi:hypothetical protein
MAISGVKTSFWLDNAAGVLTDISTFLDGIDGSSDTDEIDGTTFQPAVSVPVKVIIPGFATKGFGLSGKWTAAAETFFSGIEGRSNLNYQYGPGGTAVGQTKITGLCSCLTYTGPQSSVDGVTTFSADLRVSSRVVGTF